MECKNSYQIILALITALGFFGCIAWMLMWGFPADNKDALNSLLGVLTTIFTLQQNYFFGSSSGSVAKDATIGAIAQAVPTTGTGNGTSSPILIPDAKEVSVKTETGDVNLTPKES